MIRICLESKRAVNTISAVVLSVTLVSAVVVLSVYDQGANAATVATLVSLIGVLVMQAVGNARSADASKRADEVHHEITNGLIPAKVVEALHRDDARAAIESAVNKGKE